MKTKISHLGRSTVSVILAVMMLLSTMLIGTVSTVNAVGANNGIIPRGEKLYYDFSACKPTQLNYISQVQSNNWQWTNLGYDKVPKDYILTTTIESDMDFHQPKNGSLGQAYVNNQWKENLKVTVPENGQNLIKVSADGNSYTWSTYSGGSGGSTTESGFALTGALANNATTYADGTKFTKEDGSTNNYSLTVSVTDINNNSFRIIDATGNNYYGAHGSNPYQIDNGSHSSSQNSYGTKNDNNYNANFYFGKLGTYKIHIIDNSNGNIGVWVESVSATTYTVNYDVKGGNGSLTATGVNGSGFSVNSGTTVIFTAAPSEGYAVEGWYSDADCKNAITDAGTKTSYEVTVNANTNVYVKFESTTINPEYRLTGDLSAIKGWNGYDSALKFDTAESDGSYSKIITVTDDDVNNKFFKLIKSENGSDKYYGPYWTNDNKNNVDICGFKAGNAYDTYENDVSAFKFSKAGTYKIHYIVKTGKNTPSVWVEENTTKYNVIVADSIKSIASVNKTKAAKDEEVTVTATSIPQGQILDEVTVEGADNAQVTTTVSGNTATFVMPDHDVTVTNVTFRDANNYKVTFRSSDDKKGTVSAEYKGAKFTSGTEVTKGDEVTFTAKPEDGYALSGWTVNGAQASSTTNPYKITVNSNTTVVANFKVEDSGTIAENMHFLYGTSNKPNELQETQEYKVYEKDGKYIVTLNEKHYKELYFAFSKDDSYVNMEPNTGLKAVNPDNPKGLSLVDAKPQEYYLESVRYYFGKMSIVDENSDYIGDIKIIYDPDAKTYTVKATKDSVSDTTVNIVGKDGTIRAGYTDNDDKKTTAVLGDTELSITTPDKEIIDAPPSYQIDGKNRAVTAKRVPYGSTVTVKTTINPEATFAGHSGSDYYVKGFSINGFTGGVLTQEAGNSHTSDVYEYTFTVKKDVYADVSTIEITPIYFLKNDSDCITFYVENFMDAKAKWGDTIACYAYYNSNHALGDYPGQPMVNAEGSIYMQIPKHIGDDQSNVVKGITLNNYVWDFVHVSGDDGVRKSKNCQTYDYDDFKYLANMSQVNSSDSVANIKNIVYRFKYHTYNNTSADASADIGNVPGDTLTATKVDDTKYEVFVDYYDKPTDIFGTIINGDDAVAVNTVKAQSKYLTIVSDGYVNYSKDYLGQYATKWYIYNKAGDKVAALPPSALLYGLTKSSSDLKKLVTQGSVPQDFMSDSGASTTVISGYWDSFKSLYKDYAGTYAIINYESAIRSSGRDGAEDQPGERCDGRWYYSVDNAKITGDIRIEYADTLDSFTTMKGVNTDTFDVDTATGKNTAAEAYFTSPAGQSTTGKPIHVETTSDNSENFMFTVGATSSTTKGYTFVGWYRLIDDTYKAVNDPSELNKTTGQVARNANVVLVARYIKTPGGSMTFQHSLYKGENAGGGKATTEIQVVVKSSDGSKEYYDSGRIDSTASIDKKTISDIVTGQLVTGQQDAKITVTLYTTTKNLYNFNCYYSAENTTNITAFPPSTADFTTTVSGDRTNGRVTESVYTFSFNEYYKTHQNTLIGDDAGTVYYNFYSDITSIKVPYKVQFSYKDRTDKQKYYNRAGYVDPDNTSSYTFDEKGNDDVVVTLTESFILTLAPYESNFTKNLTWDRDNISTTDFDSSNRESSIASAVVKSIQSPRTIHLKIYKDSEGNPTPRTNTAGAFEFYEKDGSFDLPYGSVFYTKDTDGTYKYEIIAPKTYEGKQFMYWAIYSDEDCNNLVINAYNSDRAFSYVAYDNCWIAPVYGESSTPSASVKKVSTTTQFMEVTRNQWTANNADSFTGFDVDTMTKLDDFNKEYGEDKLYADFVLNFFYNGKQLSTFDPDSKKVKAGVLIQRLELDKNETGGYITDLNHYANKYSTDELDAAKKDAINKINNPNAPSTIKSVKQQIDNRRLDNKNRLQYYTRFNNVVDNSDYVFRLYTYIQYTDANDKQVVELSDPVYFTFYDIANK